MILKKWNYIKQEYEVFKVPTHWNVKLITNDLDEIVNCPHCGKELPYGEAYTSREVHNDFGLGYAVCSECYSREWERSRKYDRRNKS